MKAAKKSALILALASTTLFGFWGWGCGGDWTKNIWHAAVDGGATWVADTTYDTLDFYVPFPADQVAE